jgi:hypothetical protein
MSTASPLTKPAAAFRLALRLEELFDAWVFAAHDATLALREWAECEHHHRGDTHAVYRAALDREESAARALMAATAARAH